MSHAVTELALLDFAVNRTADRVLYLVGPRGAEKTSLLHASPRPTGATDEPPEGSLLRVRLPSTVGAAVA